MADVLTNYVKFLRGSSAAYQALANNGGYDGDTLYFISETDSSVGKLYLGSKLIAGNITADGNSVIDTLAELNDVNLPTTLANGQVLGYDATTEKWIPMDVSVAVMTGATIDTAGTAGLVPAPAAGDEGKFLRGDGTWAEVPSGAQVFADIVPTEGQSHEDAIIATVTAANATAQAGDVAVVKELIYNDKYQLTAYSYDGEHWVALSGNYNAENVYFDEDITITMAVGNATVSNGAGVIPSKGKNLKQVFEALYAKEDKEITISWPTIDFTLTSSVDAEVGSTFSRPSATFKVTGLGTYEYGSLDSAGKEYAKATTGITFNNMKVGFGTNYESTSSMTNNTAGNYGLNTTAAYTATATDIASNTVTDAPQSYTFYYKADHTKSPYKPRTNLGNLITAGTGDGTTTLKGTEVGDISNFETALGTITAKELKSTKSFSVTGYRNWYTYVGNDMNTIDSTWVRETMTSKGKGKNVSYTSAAPLSITVPDGTKRVVIALPTGKVGETTYSDYAKRVTNCIDVDGMGLDIYTAGKFAEQTIGVNDKSGANPMDYICYVYENANGFSATTLKFTIA